MINVYSAYYEKGEGYWLPIFENGALYLADNDKSLFIGMFDGGETELSKDIGKVISYDDKLYFFSRVGYEVWIVNKNKEIKYVKYCEKKAKFLSNIECEDGFAWIFENYFDNKIVRLNLRTMEAESISLTNESIYDNLPITRTVVYNRRIYFATRTKEKVKIICLECENRKLTAIDIREARYINSIAVSENRIWALYYSKNNRTILQEMTLLGESINKTDITAKIILNDSLKIDYFKMIYTEGRLVIFPTYEIGVYEFDIDTKSIINIGADQKKDYIVFNDIQKEENNIYLYSPSVGDVYTYSLENKKIEKLNLLIEKQEIMKNMDRMLSKRGIINENISLTLDIFTKYVCESEKKE